MNRGLLNFRVVCYCCLVLLFSSNYCNPQNKGKCNRCQMVCIDQETGVRSVEPLKTLGKIRGSKVCVGKKKII